MRIIALVPTFALIYFINISLGTSATYLVPWGTVCESIALASFFFLVCDYLSPTLSGQSSSFDFLGSDQVKDSAAPPDIRRLKVCSRSRQIADAADPYARKPVISPVNPSSCLSSSPQSQTSLRLPEVSAALRTTFTSLIFGYVQTLPCSLS